MTVDRAGTAHAQLPRLVAEPPVASIPTAAPEAAGRYADATDPSLAEHRARYGAAHSLSQSWRYVVQGQIAGVPVRSGPDVEARDGRIEVGGGVASGGTSISPADSAPHTWRVDQFLADDAANFSVRDHAEGITKHDSVDGRERIVFNGWLRAPGAPSRHLELHAVTFANPGESVEAATQRIRADVAGVFPPGAMIDPKQVGLAHVDVFDVRSYGGQAPDATGRLTSLTPELRVPAYAEVSNAPAGGLPMLNAQLTPSHSMTLASVPKLQSTRRRWLQRESVPEPLPWIGGADVRPTRYGRLRLHGDREHATAYWQGFLATEPRRQVTFTAHLSREEATQSADVIGERIEALVRRVLPHEHLLAGSATEL